MSLLESWNALSRRQRAAAIMSIALLAIVTAASLVWVLRDPYVPLVAAADTERLNEILRMLETAQVEHSVADHTDTVLVPRSQLLKARAAISPEDANVPPAVGLELFKETDFSSTDFAQRINYQRALQGELTRTIEKIAAVRSARVHVILPDSGFFKRNSAKPTAAVSVTLRSGKVLSAVQVRGIQRLVAASVPEIKLDDVVVLDDSGASLTRPTADIEGELSAAQLDLKRQADQYLESKLQRLLQELAPHGLAAVSVDTTLDEKQLRVTTEEPIAARAATANNHAAGVLVKERQSQRGHVGGLVQTDSDQDVDGNEWEYEYKVGSRIEQALSAPGSIRRITAAVALEGAPRELTSTAVEELVTHAVGIDRARGDAVTVLLLPAAQDASDPAVEAAHPPATNVDPVSSLAPRSWALWHQWAAVLTLSLAAMAIAIATLLWRMKRARVATAGGADVEAITAKVRGWLNEGASGAEH